MHAINIMDAVISKHNTTDKVPKYCT